MPVDPALAHLSDNLLVATVFALTLAMILYLVEYAFGRRGLVAARAEAPPQRVLVGAGGTGGTGGTGGAVELPAPAVPPAVSRAAPSAGRSRVAGAGRSAVFLTAVGWATLAGTLAARGASVGRVPWGNMYEFVLAACLVAITGWLVLLARQPVRYLGGFVLLPVVLLLGLAGTVLYTRAAPLIPALQSYWIKIHVSAAVTASGLFLVAFVTSLLFLVRQRYDRVAAGDRVRFARLGGTLGSRLPAADALERTTFRVIAAGFPIWTFAVIAGAIWAEAAWGRYWGWDPKETWAFIAWVIYAAYLHARSTAGWRGRRAVLIAVAGWLAMMFNLFAVNIVVSGLHSYAGVG